MESKVNALMEEKVRGLRDWANIADPSTIQIQGCRLHLKTMELMFGAINHAHRNDPTALPLIQAAQSNTAAIGAALDRVETLLSGQVTSGSPGNPGMVRISADSPRKQAWLLRNLVLTNLESALDVYEWIHQQSGVDGVVAGIQAARALSLEIRVVVDRLEEVLCVGDQDLDLVLTREARRSWFRSNWRVGRGGAPNNNPLIQGEDQLVEIQPGMQNLHI